MLSGHHVAKQYHILVDNFWKVLAFGKENQNQTANLKGKKNPGNSSAEKKNYIYINPLI